MKGIIIGELNDFNSNTAAHKFNINEEVLIVEYISYTFFRNILCESVNSGERYYVNEFEIDIINDTDNQTEEYKKIKSVHLFRKKIIYWLDKLGFRYIDLFSINPLMEEIEFNFTKDGYHIVNCIYKNGYNCDNGYCFVSKNISDSIIVRTRNFIIESCLLEEHIEEIKKIGFIK